MKFKTNGRFKKLGGLALLCAVFPLICTAQTNLTIETAIKVTYPTINTHAYMLETTTNLADWTQPPSYSQRWMAGDGHPVTRFFDAQDEKLFFRVQAVPRPDAVDYTIPETDAIDVDPAITNLIVTFTTDMNTNAISFAGIFMTGATPFADLHTSGSWLDAKTYTRKLALQTNTQYYAEFIFYTTNDIPALPLILNFKTRE